jgi:hypothetical protein
LLLFSRFNRENIDEGDAFCVLGNRCHVNLPIEREVLLFAYGTESAFTMPAPISAD